MRLQHFEKNPVGTDYVCGDIHGHPLELIRVLSEVKFDPTSDRLFCVGDLVDRGPDSYAMLGFLNEPWFHAVRGNHDQAVVDVAAGRRVLETYAQIGGQWFLDLLQEARERVAQAFEQLPLAIEVETDKGLVVITHAGFKGHRWEPTRALLVDPTVGRDKMKSIHYHLIKSREKWNEQWKYMIEDVYASVMGHCQVDYVQALGNTVYMDTGIGSREKGFLSIRNLMDLPV